MYRIETTENRGRCLIATELVPAGKVIVSCDPYSAAVKDEEVDRRSHLSFKESDSLQRCAGCKFAWYASREEQQLAWKQGHKEECKALQRAGSKPGPALRLVAQTLWKRLRGDAGPLEQGGSYGDVEGLVSNWERLDDDHLMMQFMALAGTTEDALPSRKEIAKLFASMACNGHTLCDDEERPTGIGIYPLGSLVNHSCTPNAVQTFKGRTLVLRALRDIQPGEEVTISYMELDKTRPERRQFLLDWYKFDIDSGAGQAQEAEPLASLLETGGPLPVRIRLWQRPPWRLDEKDTQLMGLASAPAAGLAGSSLVARNSSPSAGPDVAGSGVMAAFAATEGKSGLYQAFQRRGDDPGAEGGFPWDLEELGMVGQSEAERWQQRPLVVDCWGPAFLKGAGIWEPELRQLGRHLLGLCAVLEGGRDEMALLFDCDRNCSPFVLGKLHVLRNRLLEAQLRAHRAAGQWPAALKAALALRDYYALVYPLAFPPSALHEAAISKIALLLDQRETAQEAAQKALRQLRIVSPDSKVVFEVTQLLRAC